MVTQKAISLKIDTKLLEDLDAEVATRWRTKRNTLINIAISCYLELQDARQRARTYGNPDDKKRVINDWLKNRFPEAADWQI